MNKPSKDCWSAPSIRRVELTEEILALFKSKARTADELAKIEALERRHMPQRPAA